MPEPLTGAEIEELESLSELVKSRVWRIVRNLLNEHRIYCVDKSHMYLKKQEDRKAGEWLARSEECPKLLLLVQDKIKELQENKGGQSDGGYT